MENKCDHDWEMTYHDGHGAALTDWKCKKCGDTATTQHRAKPVSKE